MPRSRRRSLFLERLIALRGKHRTRAAAWLLHRRGLLIPLIPDALDGEERNVPEHLLELHHMEADECLEASMLDVRTVSQRAP
ncbi:hypothetical protein CEJ86_29990 [Sinorhizobium meliloti]|uniref:Uncharacterized protein n=1 Tax=Rhizobium meliloti TaxID=382 RepID=A0A2J0YUQ1_RHIML|nr:hypothetical protein CEJ86_29990 [Sinorhizobium meliloti]